VGRCTFWRSGDAHRLSCLSTGAATSCGFAARLAVAREPLGAWRGATPGAQVPGSGAGPCAFSHARPRSLLGSLPIASSLPEGTRQRLSAALVLVAWIDRTEPAGKLENRPNVAHGGPQADRCEAGSRRRRFALRRQSPTASGLP